jgi:hypothetical protein
MQLYFLLLACKSTAHADLEQLKVKNFKSIRDQTLKLRRLNVFIGGNGSASPILSACFTSSIVSLQAIFRITPRGGR